jgi:hypothetical protein
VDTQQSLISEFENVIASGSLENRAEIFRQLTNLFLVNADNYSDEQVEVFVDLFSRIAEWIDTKARAELANRLAPVKAAPAAIVRVLARDQAIEVAGPMLTQSTQLTEEDLLACANGKSHEWLLAISRRASLSEALSDLLVTQGNHEVVHSVAENEGARFSDAGFGKLVEKSIDDEHLADSIALRKDIPQKYLPSLGNNASGAVFKKIVQAIVLAREAEIKRDYTQAKALFESIQHSGKPIEPAIYDFARSGKLDETIVALSVLCRLPIEAVGNIMADKRINNDTILVLAKCAGLPWQTAKLILHLRCGELGLAPEEIETARQYFDQLQAATAQRAIRFYQARHAANKKPN